MSKIKILWADDEIDLLKPQLYFLEKKGYEVVTVTNGHDAIETYEEDSSIDVVFLDESMPGLTGLETLSKIKASRAGTPVVMITKNEAENLMEEAIGSQIDDYLIKPVNPNQILLTLKKLIDNKRLVSEKTSSDYQQEFRKIFMDINSGLNYEEWVDVYKRIIAWEIKLDESNATDMADILANQKSEANNAFFKFVEKNYLGWLKKDDGPLMSHNIMKKKVLPHLQDDKPCVFLLLDNLRFDQWKIIEPAISELFRVEEETFFYSILPTSTQYSRNAIFAGMMPSEIYKKNRDWWVFDHEEGGKNNNEHGLLTQQLKTLVRKPVKHDYVKVTNVKKAKALDDNILNLVQNDLSVIVYNFIDMLSHARTEMEVLKELAGDERAYRSLTLSWFKNSNLWTALQKIAERDIRLFITTDHGTIRVKVPSKVIGDKQTTTNLRYKSGRNLRYEKKDVFEVRNPDEAGLPRANMSSSYIFAREDKYFLYPNNYNHYNSFYNNTFQHGGVSLEEVICPFISLKSK